MFLANTCSISLFQTIAAVARCVIETYRRRGTSLPPGFKSPQHTTTPPHPHPSDDTIATAVGACFLCIFIQLTGFVLNALQIRGWWIWAYW